MKKKVLLTTALLTAAIVGVTPITSYAAQVKVIQICPDGGYQIINGNNNECLQSILSQLDGIIGNRGNNCPTVQETEVPQTEAPQTEAPQTEAPQTEAPQTEAPQTEAPQTEAAQTEAPQTEKPQTKPPVVQETETDAANLSYAEQVVKLVNEERAKEGLPAVQLDTEITAAANIRAKEIVQKFSHTRPDGSSFYTVLKEQGISYRGCGENIAYGQKSAQEVMTAWMNSSGHRANIMNKNYKNIGIGFYQDARGVKYWVQLFTY